MKTETFIIPDFLLLALTTGDEIGLSDSDKATLDRFFEDNPYHSALGTEPEGFTAWHDFRKYGVGACNCSNVTFNVWEPGK